MYEHEGQWEKAVITYDIGLQQHAAEQEVDLLKVGVYWVYLYSPSEGWSNVIGVLCLSFLSWSVFVFTQALDSFGSHHLLDNYLENYPKSKTGEIRNLIFMSAIKIGKWDLAIEERYILDKKSFNLSFKFNFEMYVHIISSFMNLYLCICSPSGSECRFSEAMYRSLNSLKDSQFSLVSSSLDIAR